MEMQARACLQQNTKVVVVCWKLNCRLCCNNSDTLELITEKFLSSNLIQSKACF